MSSQDPAKKPEEQPEEVDFHGAAVIDENGREIPITEEMIQKACEELDDSDTEE